jgi:hypothetical protein
MLMSSFQSIAFRAQSTMIEDLEKLARATSERQDLFAGNSVDVNPRFPRDIFAADGDIGVTSRKGILCTLRLQKAPD